MTVRELIRALTDHGEDGRRLNDEVLVKIDGELRTVTATYSDGALLLLAGRPVRG